MLLILKRRPVGGLFASQTTTPPPRAQAVCVDKRTVLPIYFGRRRDHVSVWRIVLSSQVLTAVADRVPNIDVKKTCRNSATVTGTLTKNDIDICIADERDAHDQLVKDWTQFSGVVKTQCVQASTAYLPSYIEMLTCLEMAKQARSLPEETTTTPRPRKQRR